MATSLPSGPSSRTATFSSALASSTDGAGRAGRAGRTKGGRGAGLVTAAIGLALLLTPLGTAFERTFGLDWLFTMRGARPAPTAVAVVGINSRTGQALGLTRLPHDWPRTVHARLVESLIERDAGAIVFDIDFSRAKPGDEDAVLARAIAAAGRVILFEWLAGRRERIITASGGDGGWTWVEQMQPPTPVPTSRRTLQYSRCGVAPRVEGARDSASAHHT